MSCGHQEFESFEDICARHLDNPRRAITEDNAQQRAYLDGDETRLDKRVRERMEREAAKREAHNAPEEVAARKHAQRCEISRRIWRAMGRDYRQYRKEYWAVMEMTADADARHGRPSIPPLAIRITLGPITFVEWLISYRYPRGPRHSMQFRHRDWSGFWIGEHDDEFWLTGQIAAARAVVQERFRV